MTATRVGRRWAAPLPANRRHAVVGVAAVAVVVRTLATTAVNAPVGPSGVSAALFGLTTAVAALGAVGLALTADDPVAGVGLLFVGVFGLLSLVTGAVALPAAVAVVGGTAAVALVHRESLPPVSAAAVGVLLVALAVGLASGVGDAVALRPTASTLALVGIAVTPVFAATTGRAALAGGLAFGAVVAVGLARPFVTGAVTLVGGGVVGTSLPVVALAAAGVVTTASAARRRGEWLLLGGVALLAFAGVPATLGRAVPFGLGAAALTLWEVER
ncbi:phosphate ABC transporter permease [Haloplanus aerogenes]|uniref:Phosphate ABC transporter permease n=1 Tax=Haloplanus aerogenes TaxID=660522 RepID=A0A3M0DTU4_9EURY|nr:phosphate ABC transporter permease [Haloplanus aerogenes]AZH25808.1 phosphate ABC transporter permease [Haloplanus aerogenes]RMB25548.1 hypothetical protein ATH50_0645 [Haloplanus aerogenes]